MYQITLSSKFQLSIPKSIREDLNLIAGQKFTFVVRGTILELVPVRSIKDARGMLSDVSYPDSSAYRDREKDSQDRDF